MGKNASIDIYSTQYAKLERGERDFAQSPSENFLRIFNLRNLKEKISLETFALDFGCGEGRHTVFLVEAGFRVVATDVSDEAIAVTRMRLQGNENVRLVKVSHPQDIQKFPEVFSLAVAWEVLHWSGNRELWVEYLKSIIGKLVPGGVLVCTMPTEDHFLIKLSVELEENHYRSYSETRNSCEFYSPTLEQLKKDFTELGAQEIQTFRYEHGREGFEASIENRFSMYGFYLRFA